MRAMFRLPRNPGAAVAVIFFWWPWAAALWLLAIPWWLLFSGPRYRVRR